MNDISNQEVNPTEQANNASIEAAIQQAQQTFASLAKPYTENVLSTDPIQPVHHINLIDNIADITDYINEQTQKHKELMVHIESFKDKLTAVSADMKSYHVEDKFAAAKKFIIEEEKAFLGLSTARKIELVVVILVGVAIISTIVKFL
jgi:hypothetical protein